jgi:RNA recognition motif-containing protein
MKSIFIGNLSFSVTEAALRWLFEAYGSVASVNIVTDRDSGQPRPTRRLPRRSTA